MFALISDGVTCTLLIMSITYSNNNGVCNVTGGGYAEYAATHENHVMQIPDNMNFIEAAAIPEAWLTAYQLLHFVGR